MIDIVRAAGDDGFETLVRALARTDETKQIELARRLDEKIAEQFIKKTPAVAGMSS